MTQRVYTGDDRRRSVRFPFSAEVIVTFEGGTFEAQGTDFNDDSLRLIHTEELKAGTEVSISVIDEMGNRVRMKGVVIRTSPTEEGRFSLVIQRTED